MDACESEDNSILTDTICKGLARQGWQNSGLRIIGQSWSAGPPWLSQAIYQKLQYIMHTQILI